MQFNKERFLKGIMVIVDYFKLLGSAENLAHLAWMVLLSIALFVCFFPFLIALAIGWFLWCFEFTKNLEEW